MSGLIARYGYLTVLFVVGLESAGVPLPGETTLIAASVYAGATHGLHIAGVVAAAVLGATLGGSLGYLIGHWGGYRLLVRYGRYARLDQGKVKLARYLFLRHGGKVVFFARFVPVLRAYAFILAGTTRMPWRRFVLFNAAGATVWASAYGLAAYLLGGEVERLSLPLAIGLGAVAVLVIAAGVRVVRQHERELEAAAEAAFRGPLEGYPGGKPL